MKITLNDLRKIIKEETNKVVSKRNLNEGHTRITSNEIEAWKNGNWGFVDEAMHGHMLGRDDKFMKPLRPPHVPTCDVCAKPLTLDDKNQYEAEGGAGYPAMHDYCAEESM